MSKLAKVDLASGGTSLQKVQVFDASLTMNLQIELEHQEGMHADVQFILPATFFHLVISRDTLSFKKNFIS